MDPNAGAQLLPHRDKAGRPLLGMLTSSSSQATKRWTVCFTLVLCLWGGGEESRGLEPGKRAGLAGLGVHEAGAPEGRGCGQHSGPAFMPKPSSAGERQQAGVTMYPMGSAQGYCAWLPKSSGRRGAGEGLRLHPVLSCGGGGSGKAEVVGQAFLSRLRAV